MESIVRISSAFSEPWVAWTMLGLLIIYLLAEWMQPGMTQYSFHSLADPKQRGNQAYNISPTSLGILLEVIAQTVFYALAAYTCIFILRPLPYFHAMGFLMTAVALIGVWTVKLGLWGVLCFTFFDKNTWSLFLRHRLNLNTCMVVMGYPMLLAALFLPWTSGEWFVWAALLLVIVELGLLTWKLFQLFLRHILGSLQIFLYLCTLEILPLAGWILLADLFIRLV